MLDYLVRFAQAHESFRLVELQALADLYKIKIEVIHYNEYTPFAVIRLPHGGNVQHLISRAILTQSIYELWGSGIDFESLYASIKTTAAEEIPKYVQSSFRFNVDSFQGSRSASKQRLLINGFAWLGWQGRIEMTNPDASFTVFEEYKDVKSYPQEERSAVKSGKIPVEPLKLWFGKFIGNGARDLVNTYSLKKRKYLSTTSMDAELALAMANMVHARPGSIVFDPFVGTGSLTVACAHYGASAFGSDIDPRTLRGKDGLSLKTNYQQYGTSGIDLGSIITDLVNTPLRGWHSPGIHGVGVHKCEWLDAIVCDPPYGVREGLRTLGKRHDPDKTIHYAPDGMASYLHPEFVAPRKPYSFTAILVDLLSFAASVLVPDGRLSFWMPTADDVEETIDVPMHHRLELVSVCVQPFNKWSRRLITYRKRHAESCPPSPTLVPTEAASRDPDANGDATASLKGVSIPGANTDADALNPFRKRYFQGFRDAVENSASSAAG